MVDLLVQVSPQAAPYYVESVNYPTDSGFDVCAIEEVTFAPKETKFVSFGVSIAGIDNDQPVGTLLYSRSSIGDTPLRLTNGVGVLDAGYRGEIKGRFDNIKDYAFTVKPGMRLCQICGHDGKPIKVKRVHKLPPGDRGAKGFGSTGL